MLVYENDCVMVIDKPCGTPSQMGTGLDPKRTASVDILAKAYLEPSGKSPYLIHRLDQSTSGLICLAKDHSMAQFLS